MSGQYKDLGETNYFALVQYARVPYSTIVHSVTAELVARGLLERFTPIPLRVNAYRVTEAGWAALDEVDPKFAIALKRVQKR